eukprot:5863154-Prymnesium_polylepis.1
MCARGPAGTPKAEARGAGHAACSKIACACARGRGIACAPRCRLDAGRATALGCGMCRTPPIPPACTEAISMTHAVAA